MPPTPATQPRSALRRLARVAALVLGVLVIFMGAAFGVLVWGLANLERPAIRTRLQALVRDAAGLELDYAHASVSLTSGLRIEDLRIATPASLRGLAPDLVHVDTVEARWSLGGLVSARRIEAITVRGVELTVVLDADGRSSFEFQPAKSTATPAAPTQRSRMIGDLLETRVPLGALTVEPVRVRLLRTAGGAVVERYAAEGLAVAAHTEGRRTILSLGARATPLVVELTRDAARAATLGLWLEATVEPGRVGLTLEAALRAQALHDSLGSLTAHRRLASLEAELRVERGRLLASLAKAELADGAAAVTGELELGDEGRIELRRADGHVDVAKVLAALPAGLMPGLPRIGGGTVELHAQRVGLDGVPRVLDGGELRADAALREVRAELPGLSAVAPSLRLQLRSGVEKKVQAELALALESLRWSSKTARASMQGGKVTLRIRDLVPDPARPTGQASVELGAEQLAFAAGSLAVEGEGLALQAGGAISTTPPFAATATVRGEHLRLRQAGKLLVDEPLHLVLRAADVRPAPRPEETAGDVHAELSLGPATVMLDAHKAQEAIDYTVDVHATSLAPVGAVVGPSIKAPWAQMGLALRSKGRIEPSAPTIRHETTLTIERPALRGPAGALFASAISLVAATHGGLRKHEGELSLALSGFHRDGAMLGDGKLVTRLRVDADAPTLSATLESSGEAAPGLTAKLELGLSKRQLTFDADLSAKRLGPMAPLLATVRALRGFGTEGLEVELKLKGALAGLLDAIRPSGEVRLAQDPVRDLAGEARFALHARRLAWRAGDRSVETPELSWEGELHTEGEARRLRADLRMGELHLAFGPTRVDLSGLSDALVATVRGRELRRLELELEDHLALEALRQELVPEYPTGDLSLVLRAKADRDGVIHVPELRLENRAAGTVAALFGGVDLGEQRRSVSVRGRLDQDLAKLWTSAQDFVGKGKLSTEVQVESGDLRRFRTASTLRIKDGHVELPRQRIKVDAVDGEIPVAADLTLGADGPTLSRRVEVNSYSELRFADQHPMLSRRSYLTAQRIDTPWINIAPLAGNLIVDNNVLSLSQLELGTRGGRVTGRAVVALQGEDTKADLNLRASGVRSSRGEPFDANTAIQLSVRQRSVQGRAEILRIGRRHLLDVLDVVDPTRADAAINKVRRALALGYPDQVRVSFNRGFAAAKITFGGIARLLRIDEIRGIPMGPIIERALEPFLGEDN